MGVVSTADRDRFALDGICVLESVIEPALLVRLREECAYFVGYTDGSMDQEGVTTRDITHRGSRYFISNKYQHSSVLPGFLFGELMTDIATALLGDVVYLFNEQWVVKGPQTGMKFAWHQDSGYIKFRDAETSHRPYLSCWCALDDVTERNGTAYLIPHGRAGTRDTILDHHRERGTNDLVGYTDGDPGDPVVAPAGSIACFSSYNLHRSSDNGSSDWRRVYLAQYSAEPIRHSSGALWKLAEPVAGVTPSRGSARDIAK